MKFSDLKAGQVFRLTTDNGDLECIYLALNCVRQSIVCLRGKHAGQVTDVEGLNLCDFEVEIADLDISFPRKENAA